MSLTRSLVVTLVLAAAVSAGRTTLLAQSPRAPGGFVEPASSPSIRPVFDPQGGRDLAPARGAFTFPYPYGTAGVRLTVADDCNGQDCVRPVGYSYWSNINNHVGRSTMLIFLGLDRRRGGSGPSLFSIDKRTGETRNLGPLFPASSPLSWSSGEGWYFSRTRPYTLYMHSGPSLLRYDVQTRRHETVFDVTAVFGAGRYIWQAHSSADDDVHSATVRDSRTYAPLGCVAYREHPRQWYFAARLGDFDECQVDKSGRWLVVKENVDGRNGEDNRVIDLETGEERVLLDENGAGGHSDLGFGYMVAIDNFNRRPGAVRTWRFDSDLRGGQPSAPVSGQGTVAYQHSAWGSGTGHIAHGNARAGVDPERQIACGSYASRSDVPRQHEIVCYRLDGTLDTLVVAPTMIDLDAPGGGTEYNKLPKGNLDVTGQYFIWTANAGTGRLDAYVVRVPAHLIAPPPDWEPVRWLDRVNTIVVGPTLRKSSGCGSCADAGAASEQRTDAGDVAVRFSASDTTRNRFVGFSGGNITTEPGEILFGLRLLNGIAEVRESGVYRRDVAFVTGDTFEVRVERGLVHYAKNGAVFYTSTEPLHYPLQVDTSLVSAGATVDHAMIRQGESGR